MQYILSETEFNKLKLKRQQLNEQELDNIQLACTLACDNTPIHYWDRIDPKPWGCIITVAKKAEIDGTVDEWYCDECPVQDACPCTYKHWSK